MRSEEFRSLKPGDKIKVKKNLIVGEIYGNLRYTRLMNNLGKKLTVKSIISNDRLYVMEDYYLIPYHFSIDMLDSWFKYGK